jgi:ABC-type transporter MlaC component
MVRRLSVSPAAALALFLLIAFFALLPATARAGSCAGAKRVTSAAHDLIRVGRAGSPAAIRRVLYRHVDMRRVMTFALGRDIRRLKGADRRRYYRRASTYAARQLARLAHYVRGNAVKVERCTRGRVVTRLLPRGERIVWKLRRGRIIDVNFRGMWVAQLLRSRFRRMLAESGHDVSAFIARLD